jgi:hypothetical protein
MRGGETGAVEFGGKKKRNTRGSIAMKSREDAKKKKEKQKASYKKMLRLINQDTGAALSDRQKSEGLSRLLGKDSGAVLSNDEIRVKTGFDSKKDFLDFKGYRQGGSVKKSKPGNSGLFGRR